MQDYLGNDLSIGDQVLVNKNTLTGSSTQRKILKKTIIEKFTPKQICTSLGYISADNVVKIFYENNNPTLSVMAAIVDAAKSKAIIELEKFKNYMEDVLDKALHNSSCNERFYDMLFDNIDDRIKYLKGEQNEV